jgi:hypothetical protein
LLAYWSENEETKTNTIQVTSFWQLPLSEYRAQRTSKRKLFSSIPIINNLEDNASSAEQDVLSALQLENQKTMFKQSYVRLDHIYEARLSMLRSYSPNRRAYHWRLDMTSYCRLATLLGLEPEIYPSTSNLWETATARLQQLANPKAIPDEVVSPTAHRIVAPSTVPSFSPSTAAPEELRTSYIPPRANQQQSTTVPRYLPRTRQTRYPNSFAHYCTTRQLPTPTTYTPRRQAGCYSFTMMISLVFGLITFYGAWQAYLKFSQSG